MLIFAMNELTNELVLTCKYEIRQKLNISQPGELFTTFNWVFMQTKLFFLRLELISMSF